MASTAEKKNGPVLLSSAPNEGLWCSRLERRPDVRLYRRGISAGTRDLAQLDPIDDKEGCKMKRQCPVDRRLIM
jgi:hypothetical protein